MNFIIKIITAIIIFIVILILTLISIIVIPLNLIRKCLNSE